MTGPDPEATRTNRRSADRRTLAKRDWANGLRKIYDQVVDEPLPPSFEELIRRLDSSEKD